MSEKILVVFPGQGSQSVGMLQGFYAQYALFKQTILEANDALGFNLWQLIQHGPQDKLNQTEYTQPAILACSVALFNVWKSCCPAMYNKIAAFAGHSLGEYTALVASGSLKFADALNLVKSRGQFMQQAVSENAVGMCAVLGIEVLQLEEICLTVREKMPKLNFVSIANINSPGQIVLAGYNSALEFAGTLAKQAGAKKVIPLPVSVASHCALMDPACSALNEKLQQIDLALPNIPVWHNAINNSVTTVAELKTALLEQLRLPVDWVKLITLMSAEYQCTDIIECGPGKVLTGLNKRINKLTNNYSLDDLENFAKLLESNQCVAE